MLTWTHSSRRLVETSSVPSRGRTTLAGESGLRASALGARAAHYLAWAARARARGDDSGASMAERKGRFWQDRYQRFCAAD